MDCWKCRWCGQPIPKTGEQGIDYVQYPEKWYYHIDCYNQKIDTKKINPDYMKREDEEHFAFADAIYRYIRQNFNRNFKDFARLYIQMGQLIEKHKDEGWTYANMYRAFKFYYDVKHNQWKKQGNNSIYIIEYVYDECEAFYKKLELEQKEREKQASAQDKPTKTILVVPRMEEKRQRKTYNLEEWC